MTVGTLIDREVRRDGARPFLTWYDDAAGARVELSVATTANWAAKIANHLVDEGVEPGDLVGVDPALHWITAVVLLGAWTAGAHVDVTASRTLDVARDPMGAGLAAMVGRQPDALVVPVTVSAEPALTLAGRTWSHDELADGATDGAQSHGLDTTARVLSTLGYNTVHGLDAGLLVPLAAGGSVVLVSNADESRIDDKCAVERVTHTATARAVGLLPRWHPS